MSPSRPGASSSLPFRRASVLALALALASTSVHAVGAVRGGDRGLLYVAMAVLCTICAGMTLRHGRIHDWFVMGLVNAAMISTHALLMGGASGRMAHLSARQHLARHLHGQGFDVAHTGAGLAALELLLCLSVLTVWAVRPAPARTTANPSARSAGALTA